MTVVFVVVCPFCGLTLDAIPVEPGETWGPAASWGAIAQAIHNRSCRRYVRQLALPGIR